MLVSYRAVPYRIVPWVRLAACASTPAGPTLAWVMPKFAES